VEEEAAVVAFRRHTLLPLDDCLYALQTSIPHLTRSSLHRCLQRHGISRLPQFEESKARSKFKQYPIGYFHIDIAEVRTEEGKLHLFVAIDRTSKFAYAELHAQSNRRVAVAFLRSLIKVVPYKIHTILTDNVCSSVICRLTAMVPPPDTSHTCSTYAAVSMASSIALQRSIIPGPMVRSNA
jgi:transposase-like protein